MKGKATRRSYRKGTKSKMKGTLGLHLQVQLGQISANASSSAPPPRRFLQNLLESAPSDLPPQPFVHALDVDADADGDGDDKDFILSQDFFCTPDYITPDNQNLQNGLDCNDCNKENIPCPDSPEKLKTAKTKRCPQDSISMKPLSPISSCHQQIMEPDQDIIDSDEVMLEKTAVKKTKRSQNYVSQSAVALRCRVMPPPCIKNPYLKNGSEMDVDPFGNQRSKCSGFFSAIMGGEGLSRYHTDFHEIEQIGTGNFSRVFKVLKRIDGCLYAVKHTTRQLHQDIDRRKAFMEVQALAALGSHENIVTYYSSWFENEQLYIQLELCDHSLSYKSTQIFTEREVLVVLHQIAKALQFMHEKGIAHLDVKPDNIYVKNGVYKLGDFGCATLLDKTLPVEEGDARYMPQEILNEIYDHLDKVDIFSLGAAVYERIRGSPLPESGHPFLNLREGKLPLLPGHTMQFQNLLKAMVDPDPARRPSAKELVGNPIFDRI